MGINYGLIGCGGAGTNRHLPAVRANPRTSLRGVCDLDEERAVSVADDNDVAAYTGAESMSESEGLDAVSVATPPPAHRDVLDDIVQTGVDILVEKPFVTTADDAREVLEQVGSSQIVTEVNNQLFKPVVRRAAEAVDRGAVGTVRQVYTHSSLPDLEQFLNSHPDWITSLPGSVFGENLPHWIYLTRRFMGNSREVKTQVLGSTTHPDINFDEISAQLQGEDANGEIRMVVDATSSDFVVVVGDEGSLIVDLDNRVNYIVNSPSGAADVLRNNFLNSANIARQTLSRAIDHGLTVGLRKYGSQDNLSVMDKAYETDGHYQQITEVVTRDGLTVKPTDIVNNVQTYQDIVRSINRP
jgi:predicted dehydrogenase